MVTRDEKITQLSMLSTKEAWQKMQDSHYSTTCKKRVFEDATKRKVTKHKAGQESVFLKS